MDLDLPVGGLRLRDTFEWDICNPDNCAEEFARMLLNELSVADLDNVHALANHIRSQIESYCVRQALCLKQNVEACCQEDLSNLEGSDSGEILAEI